jgi:hypothetical protein
MHRSDVNDTNPLQISSVPISFVVVIVESVLLGAYTAHRRNFIDVIGVVVVITFSFAAVRGIACVVFFDWLSIAREYVSFPRSFVRSLPVDPSSSSSARRRVSGIKTNAGKETSSITVW